MNQSADFQSYKAQLEQEKKEAASTGGKPKFNPYARRKVKPKILWEVGQKDEDGKDGSEGAPADGAKKEESANKRDDSDDGANNGEKENKRDEIFGGSQNASLVGQMHQFAIDDGTSMMGGAFGSLGFKPKRAPVRVRKGISLAEYQERKAAGTL